MRRSFPISLSAANKKRRPDPAKSQKRRNEAQQKYSVIRIIPYPGIVVKYQFGHDPGSVVYQLFR